MTIIYPTKSEFLDKVKKKNNQLIWTTLRSDLDTPVSTYLKLCEQKTNSFLLESVQDGTYRGRYSILGFDPDIIWKCKNGIAYKKVIKKNNSQFTKEPRKPLASLQELINSSKINLPSHLPPMSAGLIGYLGYEIIEEYEKLPKRKKNNINIPDGFFIRPKTLAIFDDIKNEITLISPYWFKNKKNYEKDYISIRNNLKNLINIINSPLKYKRKKPINKFVKPRSNIKKNTFLNMVKKAKKYIYEGEIFQVVLSQRFKTTFLPSPFELYRSLRSLNPSPFLFYFNLEESLKEKFSIIGSSPEILVKLKDKEITIRPIAGTRKRGSNLKEDIRLKKDLLSDPKEISEHLMLLDLGRNDVGRMAKVNTVRVTEKMKVEFYSHVMHIVSNVVGIAKSTKNLVEILMSGFPAGTVSGAPKIRAMEIINELEPDSREIYAGCVGYFSANGDMETCITLRTAIIKNSQMFVQAGAGIVADSVPEKEYLETINKSAALFKAAEMSYNI